MKGDLSEHDRTRTEDPSHARPDTALDQGALDIRDAAGPSRGRRLAMRQIRIIDFFWVCHDKNREINGLSHLRRNRDPRLGDGLQGRLLGRLARCLAGSSDRNGPSNSACCLPTREAGCVLC